MKPRSVCFPILLLIAMSFALPVAAKQGVVATIHTEIPLKAADGTQISISWTLANEKTGRPFSAYGVFIRLIGPDGDSTEAFAGYPARPIGSYQATSTIPRGGVVSIEVGIAGTMTDREGNSERSDWLMAVTNNLIEQ